MAGGKAKALGGSRDALLPKSAIGRSNLRRVNNRAGQLDAGMLSVAAGLRTSGPVPVW